MFHRLWHSQVRGESLSASKANAGDKVPEAFESVWQEIGRKEIVRMTEAVQIEQHVHVERLPHLWFHHAQISTYVAKDAWAFIGSDAVDRVAWPILAIE